MTSHPKKYWAFISYSSKDKKWGQWLHRRLENYPIPKEFQGIKLCDEAVLGENLRPIFRDRDELSSSSSLGPVILDALKRSRYLIVLCSKNSAQSKWVNKEIEDFNALDGEKNILALILDGEPNATSNDKLDDSEECFPPALRYPSEPLAGDLRKEGDGKVRGFLKILAGVAELNFDVLYRRHERTKKIKLYAIGCLALLIMLSLATLTSYAFRKKEEALEAKQQTVVMLHKSIKSSIELSQQRGYWKQSMGLIKHARDQKYSDPIELAFYELMAMEGMNQSTSKYLLALENEEMSPRHKARLRLFQGSQALMLGQRVLARNHLTEALMMGLDDADKLLAKALLTENTAQAIVNLEQALKIKPYLYRARQSLCVLYIFYGNEDKAKTTINVAKSLFPRDENIILLECWFHTFRGRYDYAEKLLTSVSHKLEPNTLRLFQLHYMQIDHLRHQLITMGNELTEEEEIAQRTKQQKYIADTASLLFSTKEYNNGVGKTARLPHTALLEDTILAFGRALIIIGSDRNAGIKYLDKTIDKHQDGAFFFLRGWLYYLKDDYEAAVQDFKSASQCKSMFSGINEHAYMWIAKAEAIWFTKSNRKEIGRRAVDSFHIAHKYNEFKPWVYQWASDIARNTGNFIMSNYWASHLPPQSAIKFQYLSQNQLQVRNFTKAISISEQGLTLYPKHRKLLIINDRAKTKLPFETKLPE